LHLTVVGATKVTQTNPRSGIVGLALVATIGVTGSLPASSSGQPPVSRSQTREPQKGTPEEIEQYKNGLAQRIKDDRRTAKRGDLLTPELTTFLIRRVRQLADDKEGTRALALIKESNPGEIPLQVNGKYPDDAALATTPPLILESFPELPEGIEYRFVGCRLMLLAQDSRLVLDYTEECFW
jgi:hypothetical protein